MNEQKAIEIELLTKKAESAFQDLSDAHAALGLTVGDVDYLKRIYTLLEAHIALMAMCGEI